MIRSSCAILLFCLAAPLAAQSLTCPGSSATGCETYHYHLQAWSPEFRSTSEFSGFNTFASATACEENRRAAQATNAQAIQFLATAARRMKTEANVYGECHCDRTRDTAHPNYLDDRMRNYQVRTEQEFRHHMLGELLRRGLEPGSELARSFANAPSRFPSSALGRERTLPVEGSERLLRPEDAVLLEARTTAVPSEGEWYKDVQLATVALETPAPAKMGASSDHVFVRSEVSRIQEIVLEASWSGDPPARIFRACAERMQLLSKLGRMIDSGAPDSLLAREGQKAVYDDASLERFITNLFGREAAARWVPRNPEEMSFELPPAIAADPAAVLQDPDERYSVDEQKLALYAYLVKNPLNPGEEVWLRSLAESWLEE